MPNSEATPAATIPRGPTQLMKALSRHVSSDCRKLQNTPSGRASTTTIRKTNRLSRVRTSVIWSTVMLAESRMNSNEMRSSVRLSLKSRMSCRKGTSRFAK